MNGLEAGSVDTLDTDPATLEKLLGTQFDLALQRLRDQPAPMDPQSAVARFSSAF
jgi:hypothetical protein